MNANEPITSQQLNRERWKRGRLGYKLHAGQQKLKDAFLSRSKGQLFVSEFGRQFGKTYFWTVVALEIAHQIPNAKIRIGTAFHTDLVEFIIPSFEAVTEDCPKDLKPVFKQQKSKYICHNKSEIKLVGLDRKPNGMRGSALDFILIDEAGFTKALGYLYKHVIIPTTTHRPQCRIAMSSSTPTETDHEFFDFVEKAKLENAYSVGTIYENPMVDEATIGRLKYEMGGEDSPEWKTEYLCKRVRNTTLAIVPEWDEGLYVRDVARDDKYQFYHKYVAMDLGVVRHKTASLYGYYHFERSQLIIEDEHTVMGRQMTTKNLQAHIKNRELLNWYSGYESLIRNEKEVSEEEIKAVESFWDLNQPKTFLKVSDNNNPLLNQDLSFLHKLHFTATDKGRLEEMVNTLRILVRSGGLIVHPQCKQLIGCLNVGVWDDKRDQFKEHKVYGHFDALAALIYLVRNLNRVTNPIPADYGADRNNQIVILRNHESHAAKDMRRAFNLRGST
jgi:hypothetical protein